MKLSAVSFGKRVKTCRRQEVGAVSHLFSSYM